LSNKISGVVQEVQTYNTKIGPMFNVVVGGEKYGNGKYAPKCSAGDVVEFEVAYNGNYKNVAPRTLTVVGKASAAAVAAEAASAPARSASTGSYDARQDVISRQAALNSALTFVGLLASQDALPVTKTAKIGSKIEAIEALVRKYTGDFHLQSTGKEMDFPEGEDVKANDPEDGEWK
jgi:hypothetical protein